MAGIAVETVTASSAVGHVGGVVADVTATPSARSRSQAGGALEVAARHVVAHRGQHGRDRAHAGAADADDVDAHRAGEIEPTVEWLSHDGRAPRPAPATRSAASGWAKRCSGGGHRVQSARLGEERRQHLVEAVGVELVVGHPHRRPDGDQRLGVGRLVVAGGDRQRHEHRAEADRGQLGHRRAAGAADDHVGRREQALDAVLVPTRWYTRPSGAVVGGRRSSAAGDAPAADASQSRAPTTWRTARSDAVPPALGQPRDRVVDAARAERAAEHRPRRAIGGQAELGPGRGAIPGAVDGEDLRAAPGCR